MDYPPKIERLDFSMFHPLDHWPFTAHCREHYPRGLKSGFYHFQLAWEFKWVDQLHAATFCRMGRHKPMTWFQPGYNRMHEACRHCFKPLGPWQPMDNIQE